MSRWTILQVGEFRRETRDDGSVAVFLPGWSFECPDGNLAGMSAHIQMGFAEDGSEAPAIVFADAKTADAFRLHGWKLAELKAKAT